MVEPFLVMAALAGLGVAAVAGPLGSFVVWRRMAYFGDATAHAAVLGVALAIVTDLPVTLGVLIVAAAMAALVSRLSESGAPIDTALGVASHGALAFGLVALSVSGGPRGDLMGLLFGDILTVTLVDLAIIWGGAAVVLAVLIWRWPGLLIATLSPELALAGGGRPARERLILGLLIALVVAVALKVVGALLIGAMLIIPAATARPLARTTRSHGDVSGNCRRGRRVDRSGAVGDAGQPDRPDNCGHGRRTVRIGKHRTGERGLGVCPGAPSSV